MLRTHSPPGRKTVETSRTYESLTKTNSEVIEKDDKVLRRSDETILKKEIVSSRTVIEPDYCSLMGANIFRSPVAAILASVLATLMIEVALWLVEARMLDGGTA